MKKTFRNLILTAMVLLLLGPSSAAAQSEKGEVGQLPRSRPVDESGTTRVTVMIFMVDLIEIIDAEQSFLADIAVIAEWRDPRLAGIWDELHIVDASTVWTPRLQVVNRRQLDQSLGESVEVMPDGTVTHRQRLTGHFTSLLDLRDFPLDEQRFQIQVVAPGVDVAEVELVPDDEPPMRLEMLSISNWSVEPARIVPYTMPAAAGRTLPGLALELEATRRFSYYLVQVLLPLIAIIMMSWTVFWVDPTVVPARMSVVVTAMLTIIAYRFALGSMVPKLPYLTLLDWFLLGATFLVLLALVAVAATSYLVSKGRERQVATLNRWSRFAFPASFLILVAVLWLA
jgi:hypothetical protein